MQSQQLELRKARRRSRITLSCDPCRTRKLKCNREKPCQNCTAREEQGACKFRAAVNPGTLGAQSPAHGQRGPAEARPVACGDRRGGSVATSASPVRSDSNLNGDAMRQRIDHLEEMVKKLIADHPPAAEPMPQSSFGVGVYTPEKSPKPLPGSSAARGPTGQDLPLGATGKTVMDGVRSVYLGGDDWSVLLQEINELRRTWDQEQDDASNHSLRPTLSHTVDGSSLLFDQMKPLEKMGIISSLPPKHEVDWLIAQFFDSQTFSISVPPILHKPTFMREYDEHWRNPSRTDFIWLGLLFSILGVTMLAYHQYGESPEYQGLSESLFQLYRMRTAQCLLSGDIAKCLPYTVETLRFNATAELNRKDDNRRGLWIMTGVVVRTAINMGYHRDPAHMPSISVMQAEYRRRVWSSVVSMDDMASFLGGFPRTMSSVYSDTLEPRNLFDWELSEDMTTLPPSRPLAEATAVTYLIVKGRLFRELGRVADFNSNPSLGSYENALEIDRAVRDVYESFPPYMEAPVLPTPSSGRTTPPVRNLASFSNLSLVCMYHRGVCTLHRKFLAKGRSDGRFKFSHDRCISSALGLLSFQEGLDPGFYSLSQTRQILMLGAMVLFLELSLRRKDPDEEATPDSDVLLEALERSCALLAGAVDSCEEAKKVHEFLVGMLLGFRAGPGTATTDAVAPEVPERLAVSIGSPFFDASNVNFPLDKNWPDMDFDWTTWDTFIEGTTFESRPTY